MPLKHLKNIEASLPNFVIINNSSLRKQKQKQEWNKERLFLWQTDQKLFFSGFATYSPVLPAAIGIDPRFGPGSVDMILDGIVDLEVDKTSLPTLILMDDQGKVALSIQVDPSLSVLVCKNDYDVSYIIRNWLSNHLPKLKIHSFFVTWKKWSVKVEG